MIENTNVCLWFRKYIQSMITSHNEDAHYVAEVCHSNKYNNLYCPFSDTNAIEHCAVTIGPHIMWYGCFVVM